MQKRDTPEQWLPLLERHGIHSARQLAERLDVSVATAVRLLHGEQTSAGTIEVAARWLGVEVAEVHRLRGEVALPPFHLPTEASHLSPRQRAAILAVVRAMLEPLHATTMTEVAALHAEGAEQLRIRPRRNSGTSPRTPPDVGGSA